MDDSLQLADQASLRELGRRLARYRLNRNLPQQKLADEAGLSLRTLIRLEQGESVQLVNFIRVLRALDLLDNLDALVPEPAPSPLQQLKQQGRLRRRASGAEVREDGEEPWSWGDEA